MELHRIAGRTVRPHTGVLLFRDEQGDFLLQLTSHLKSTISAQSEQQHQITIQELRSSLLFIVLDSHCSTHPNWRGFQ